MGKPQPINISTLAPEQLQELAKMVSEEKSGLERSAVVLKQLAATWVQSGSAVDELKEMESGQSMLVPMTESLYVPGHLRDNNSVMVDIGTGYFAQKSCDDAVEYCKRRVDYIKDNLDSVGERIKEKSQALQQIQSVFTAKVQAAQQEQVSKVPA